jgi:hypothetical protein
MGQPFRSRTEKTIKFVVPKLVVDANMLLVFVVGSVDHSMLGVAKRVKEYRPEDYDILYTYLSLFSEIILLPNTVSEVSNLLDQFTGERRRTCMELLAALTASRSETYIASDIAAQQPEYLALGITDAAILCILQKDTYLLTSDFDLYLAALCRSHDAQLFGDLRN